MSTSVTGTSTQDVITAIIANGVICAVFVTCFFALRLKFQRIYEPKSYFDFVPPNERPQPLSASPTRWLYELVTKDPKFIINQAGLDGYLFIRYLFNSAAICGIGMLIWIILLPVNATNGNGESGLNQLSISNVRSPGRYYAHVFMSWFFYGGVIFVIYRELLFYCNLKFASMATPHYAKKLSSRSVIFQAVPNEYRDENEFFKLYEGVKRVWVARTQSKLTKKVSQREALCNQLENSLNVLLTKACKACIKAEKKGETIEPADELVCYVPQKKWPTIKESKFNPFGKKKDLMDHCIEKIPELNKEIEELQKNYKDSPVMNSIVVEFENQYYAQQAFQSTLHTAPLHLTARQIGVEPEDIFWPNMRLFWWEALVRRIGAIAVITFVIIIWAIPVGFVGLISNITYLTNKMHWLNFIYHLPEELLGLITSLLPTVLLALLMMLLPIFIRTCAKFSGCRTTQSIEHFTQQAYFAFQVVQTFLVVTIASSFSSVVTQIVEQPTAAMAILSNNLPKASNFFISYIILQGFSIAGGSLLQVVPLILFFILGYAFDNTLRKKWNRWSTIGSYAWGTTFPIYSALAVITFSYAIISPMILLFSTVAFILTWIAYMNNANFIVGKGTDAMGLYYPRSLFQMFVGVYLGQICLIGLYAVSKSWGCIVLQAVFLGFSVFAHLQLSQAFDRLIEVVPNSVMRPLNGEDETLSWSAPVAKNEKSPFYSTDELVRDLAQVPLLADSDSPLIEKEQGFLLRFMQPWVYLSFAEVKKYLPDSFYEMPPESDEHAFDYPVVSAKCPVVWIPKDPMGLSITLIEKFKDIVEISDENSAFTEKGQPYFTGAAPTEGVKL